MRTLYFSGSGSGGGRVFFGALNLEPALKRGSLVLGSTGTSRSSARDLGSRLRKGEKEEELHDSISQHHSAQVSSPQITSTQLISNQP